MINFGSLRLQSLIMIIVYQLFIFLWSVYGMNQFTLGPICNTVNFNGFTKKVTFVLMISLFLLCYFGYF